MKQHVPNILFWTADRSYLNQIEQDISSIVTVKVGDFVSEGEAFIQKMQPDILIVDLNSHAVAVQAALSKVTNSPLGSKMAVIVTAENTSAATTRWMITEGITDFLPQPFSAADINETIISAKNKLTEKTPNNTSSGKVITFMHSSGGVGATTVAVNAAYNLMKTGKTVCLLDLDLQFGSITAQLDLPATNGIFELIDVPTRFDTSLFLAATIEHESGLRVLPAPKAPIPFDLLESDLLLNILNAAKQNFDYVVIDLPLTITNWTSTVLSNSDFIGLVMGFSVPAVKQTKRLLELLKENGHYSLPLSIICNNYTKQFWTSESDISLKQVEKALDQPIKFTIPYDHKTINIAHNQGALLDVVNKRSDICKGINSMTADIVKNFT